MATISQMLDTYVFSSKEARNKNCLGNKIYDGKIDTPDKVMLEVNRSFEAGYLRAKGDKGKVWIVVEIDTYGSEHTTHNARDYAGLKLCTTEAERDAEIARISTDSFAEYRVETVTF